MIASWPDASAYEALRSGGLLEVHEDEPTPLASAEGVENEPSGRLVTVSKDITTFVTPKFRATDNATRMEGEFHREVPLESIVRDALTFLRATTAGSEDDLRALANAWASSPPREANEAFTRPSVVVPLEIPLRVGALFDGLDAGRYREFGAPRLVEDGWRFEFSYPSRSLRDPSGNFSVFVSKLGKVSAYASDRAIHGDEAQATAWLEGALALHGLKPTNVTFESLYGPVPNCRG